MDRPFLPPPPDRLTPEQAAMLDLLDRIKELEQIASVERSVRIAFENELFERLHALDIRIRKLERRA